MKLFIYTLLCISFSITMLYGQEQVPEKEGSDFDHIDTYEPATFQLKPVTIGELGLEEYLKEYELYDFDFKALHEHVYKDTYGTEFLIHGPNWKYLIYLQQNDIRSPQYVEAINGEIVTKRSIETDSEYTVETFKGFTDKNRNNVVRYTVTEDNFWGYIYDKEKNDWLFFESTRHFLKNDEVQNVLLVYRLEDIKRPNARSCESTIMALEDQEEIHIGDKTFAAKGGTIHCTPKYLEIATDADYEYYQKYQNSGGANAKILSVLNQTEGIYSIYFNILFSVIAQHTYTTSADPYTTIQSLGLVNEFRANIPSIFLNNGIAPDLSMLFTGHRRLKNNNGKLEVVGRASGIGTICRAADASVVICDEWGNYDTVAHEIGHSFGMIHPFEISGNTECTTDPGIMCYYTTGYFFNASNVTQAQNHIVSYGSCLNNIDPSTVGNDWEMTWTNSRNKRRLGGWYFNNGDHKLAGDFDGDGDEELLFMSSSTWSGMEDYSCDNGTDWYEVWKNNGSRWIGSWYMNNGDRHFTGDFDGDGITDLLSMSVSNAWATVQGFDAATNSWYFKWSNYGSFKISSWHIRSTDQFQIGDFDGDGKDELLGFSYDWASLFDFNTGGFTQRWTNSGSGDIGGVASNYSHRYTVGKFTDTNADELLTWVNSWVTVLRFNNSTSQWNWIWSQYGASNFASMQILPLNSEQRILAGNFDQDAKDEVLNINNTWAATADFNGSTFQQNWNNGGTAKLDDWTLYGAGNDYLTVKATPHNGKHLLALKYYEIYDWFYYEKWPELSSMYRSNELHNKNSSTTQVEAIVPDTYSIALYPNPAIEEIQVKIQSKDHDLNGMKIELYDIRGRKLITKDVHEMNTKINLSIYNTGTYLIKFSGRNGFSKTHKIMISK